MDQHVGCYKRVGFCCALLFGASVLSMTNAFGAEPGSEYGMATYSAPYLSDQARAIIKMYAPGKKSLPEPGDVETWSRIQLLGRQRSAAVLEAYAKSGGAYQRQKAEIEGVDAYWISTDKTNDNGPVLVYTHGGGYVGGSGKDVHPGVVAIANAAGMRLLSIDYRLAPEFPFPAAVEDSVKAYRWLLEQGQAHDQIGWFGASAGGGLTLAAVHALKQQGLPLPGAIAALSPWTDLTLVSESYFTLDADDPAFTRDDLIIYARTYYQDADPMNPLISPVYGEFTDFPPTFIQVGSKEILLSDSLRVARHARASGVDVTLDVWDGLWHVFQFFNVPESGQAIEDLGEFFNQHLIRK